MFFEVLKERSRLYFLPFFGWLLLLFLLSTKVQVQIVEADWILIGEDKIGHFVAYLMLSVLGLWALQQNNWLTKLATIILVFLCSFYGLILEIAQYLFFPDRYFEWKDVLSDVAGVFIGQQLFYFFKKI